MNVIYKKTLIQRITDARRDAQLKNREIEKIVLTMAEARALLSELGFTSLICYGTGYFFSDFEAWLCLAEHEYNHAGPQPALRVLGIDIEVSR